MTTRIAKALSGFLLIALLLAGCGNKGPLYLPEENGGSETVEEASEDSEDRR